MTARLCSRWRWRDRGKLERMVGAPLLSLFVDTLDGTYQLPAAICLARVWQAEVHVETMVALRGQVQSKLPDMTSDAGAVWAIIEHELRNK